jgi:DNA transformation protein
MVASDTYAEFLREQLAPLGRVTLRRMFGKTGVFCDGVMFGVVTENTLYFRVDDQNRVTFREAEAFPPLNYAKQGQTIDLAFWRAPERLFDEPDELIAWAHAALAAAHRVAAKSRRQSSPKRHGNASAREQPDLRYSGQVAQPLLALPATPQPR